MTGFVVHWVTTTVSLLLALPLPTGLFQPVVAQQDIPAGQVVGQFGGVELAPPGQLLPFPQAAMQLVQQIQQQQQPLAFAPALDGVAAAAAEQGEMAEGLQQQQQQQQQAQEQPQPHAFDMEGDIGPPTEADFLQIQQQQQQQQDVPDEVFEEMMMQEFQMQEQWDAEDGIVHPHPHVIDMEGDVGLPTDADTLQYQQQLAQQQQQMLQQAQQQAQQLQQGLGQGQGVHNVLQALLQQVQVLQHQVQDLQQQQQQQLQPGGGAGGVGAADIAMGEANGAAATAAATAAAGGGDEAGSSMQANSTAATGAHPAAAAGDAEMDLDVPFAVEATNGVEFGQAGAAGGEGVWGSVMGAWIQGG